MSYMFVVSPCFGCGKLFTYNPLWVPSIPIQGIKEPVCVACVTLVNPKRIANGLEPIVIHPEAYEACPEEDLELP